MSDLSRGLAAVGMALLIAAAILLSGCAAALPIGMGLAGAISAGSDVVGMIKWWEDRTFQAEANQALQAQAEEIKRLREEIAATRQQLHDDLVRLIPPP